MKRVLQWILILSLVATLFAPLGMLAQAAEGAADDTASETADLLQDDESAPDTSTEAFGLRCEIEPKDAAPGDKVLVTVYLTGYDNPSNFDIFGAQVYVSFDADLVICRKPSMKSLVEAASDDMCSTNATAERVQFIYASLNAEQKPLSRETSALFSFELILRSTAELDELPLTIESFKVSESPKLNFAEPQPPLIVGILPRVLLNGRGIEAGEAPEFPGAVTVSFNKGAAKLTAGGQTSNITSPLVLDTPGAYTVDVEDSLGNKDFVSFTITLENERQSVVDTLKDNLAGLSEIVLAETDLDYLTAMREIYNSLTDEEKAEVGSIAALEQAIEEVMEMRVVPTPVRGAYPTNPPKEQEKTGKDNTWLFIVLGVVAVAIVGVCVWLFLRVKSKAGAADGDDAEDKNGRKEAASQSDEELDEDEDWD